VEDLAWTGSHLVMAGERGQIYLGDVDRGLVRKVTTTGGRGLGVASAGDDGAIVCDPKRGQVTHVDLTNGRLTDLIPEGVVLQHANSVALDSAGRIYVSDSGGWGTADGRVIVLDIDGTASIQGDDFADFTNGIRVSPDDSCLYIVESRFGLSRAALNDGEIGAKEIVAQLPGVVGDGLAFCADGTILVACYQPNVILRVDPRTGLVETALRDDEGVQLILPTNVAFYGENLDSLAIANLGGRHITTVNLGLWGAPVQATRISSPSIGSEFSPSRIREPRPQTGASK